MNLRTLELIADKLPHWFPLPFRYKNMRSDYRAKILEVEPDAFPLNDYPICPFTGTLFVTWLDERSVDDNGHYQDWVFGEMPELVDGPVAYMPRVLPGMDFREVVRKYRHMYYPELFLRTDKPIRNWNEYYCNVVAGMKGFGIRPKTIVYPCEAQPWEGSLIRAIREHLPDTRIIGFDNLNVCEGNISDYLTMEKPDILMVQGRFHLGMLERYGYGAPIRLGCSFRRSPRAKGILIATSIDREQSERFLKDILPFIPEGERIIIKTHPLSGMKGSDIPMECAMQVCDVCLYTLTAVGIDALKYGVYPIHVKGYGYDKMAGVPERGSVIPRHAYAEVCRFRAWDRISHYNWSVKAYEAHDRIVNWSPYFVRRILNGEM